MTDRLNRRCLRTARHDAARISGRSGPVIGTLIGALVLAGCGGSGDNPAASLVACADLTTASGLAAAKLPIADTRIVSAVAHAATAASGTVPALPAHCEVIGKMAAHKGIDNQNYATTFRMRLPLAGEWNGRFYMQGGGGTDGTVGDAIDADRANPLGRGFAVIATDSGHDNATNSNPAAGGGAAFGLDPQARTDYFYNALDMTARTGKSLVKASYGREPDKSYFFGCSNGGRQGMMFTQRFPALFDGVVAGAPAYRVSNASLASAWTQQTAAELVEPGYKANGTVPDTSKAFSDADLRLVAGAITGACDALDGAADGIVADFQACTSTRVHPALQALSCGAGAKTAACLTDGQIAAVKRIQAGPTNSLSQPLYNAWPWDPGLWTPFLPTQATGLQAWALGVPAVPGAFPGLNIGQTLVASYLPLVASTPPVPTPVTELARYMLTLDFDTTPPLFAATNATFIQSSNQLMHQLNPDLGDFKARGGKLLFYHGTGDGIFSIFDTIDYLDRVESVSGGKAREFARLFAVPGMTHCSGGPATSNIDLLGAVVDWVEKGTVPDVLTATATASSGFAGRTRPVCAYPKVARLKPGATNLESADSFACMP